MIIFSLAPIAHGVLVLKAGVRWVQGRELVTLFPHKISILGANYYALERVIWSRITAARITNPFATIW